MTDQMDNRLRELVTKLADSAPPAPPFPRTTTKPVGIGRRAPAWVLAVAGATAVLLLIGVPFLLFSGGTTEEDVATTPAPTPTTVAPPPTTAPARAATACAPAGLLVRALEADGAAGHIVTPLRFINVSADPCMLDEPVSVTGIGVGGEEVPAVLGTYIPIGGPTDPLVAAGDSRVMLVEVGTGCEGGSLVGPAADSVRVTLPGGEVTVPFSGDLGCQFSYSSFGEWLGAEPVTGAEQAIVESIRAFAADPTAERFAEISFSESVILTLGPQLARELDQSSLSDPASWVFGTEYDGFRAGVAPFSALTFLSEERPVGVTTGPHDHCAAPPMPIYERLTGLRQISIQPTDATSCLEWWAIDLFLLESGEVAGVTLDLWEP